MSKNLAQAAIRPPIVAVVGHIDHGKSTLLDYIRNTRVVESEAGGITQHLSAYEATHTNNGGEHHITFLDTPGHEAFVAMRSRGLEVADVAILVVSSEEGAKPQTLEALKLITNIGLPYIVAFTKIDKPGQNIEKAKMSLLENQVFLEGLGGDVPWVAISSKSGEGIAELLDLILLAAELRGLSAQTDVPGSGTVIEAHVDPRRGNTATLIVQNGSVKSGAFVVAEDAYAPVRIMENFLGKPIKEAHPGSPIRIVGFSVLPTVGAKWTTIESKKEAEALVGKFRNSISVARPGGAPSPAVAPGDTAPTEEPEIFVLPLAIKTDVAGTGEAVLHELQKLPKDPAMEVRVVLQGTGSVSEADIKFVGAGKVPGLIAAFNVKVEPAARELAERQGVTIGSFDVIYKLAEWLEAEVAARRPKQKVQEQTGAAKVLKFFSKQKGKVVLGGRVEEGELHVGEEVRILRRDVVLGQGKITSLQTQKKDVRTVEAGSEFGMMLQTNTEPASGDRLEAFETVYK